MIIVDNYLDIKPATYRAVALGNFDGVHLGHQELIRQMVKNAKQHNGESIVMSFCPHPLEVLTNETPAILSTTKEKADRISDLGVGYFWKCGFDMNVANLSPERFVRELLIDQLEINHVFVGFNYTFGRNAEGDVQKLDEICAKYGVDVTVIPPILYNEEIVSSTLIRKKLDEGDIVAVNNLLGYKYILEGEVIHGNELGRTIGFPTANMDVDKEKALPSNGVYSGVFICNNIKYKAVVNIGLRPTIGDVSVPVVEANCIETDDKMNFYGKMGKLYLYKKLRDELKLSSLRELIDVINKDVEVAKVQLDTFIKEI